MKHPADTRTPELPLASGETGNSGGLRLDEMRRRAAQIEAKLAGTMVRGAYLGASKPACHGNVLRVRTGLTQGEFARRAGVSERSLRTWEASDRPLRDCPKVHAPIVAALAALGVTYTGMQPVRKPGAVRYRCPMTGSTWSGRGLKPAWLRVALDEGGKRLADFEV